MGKGIYDFVKITDLKDMLKKSEKAYGDKEAFRFKTKEPGKFRDISYKEFASQVNALGTSLINLNLKDMVPGVNSQYDFSVKNSKNDKVSDVTIEYQITIKTYHFIPLEINLYQIVNNEEVYIGTCDESYTRNEDNELVCNMPIKEMVKSTNTMDNYRLKLNFSSEYSDIKYSDLVDFINIEINSWQKI